MTGPVPLADVITQSLAHAGRPELERRATVTVGDANALTVYDTHTYQQAGEVLTGLTALGTEIETEFEPSVRKAYELHRELTARRKRWLEPVEQACSRLRRLMSEWKTAQDRAQREREREAAEALRHAEADRLAREAALLESHGQAELAAAVLEQAITTPPPAVVLPTSTPKLEGVGYMDVWRWRLVNLAHVPREFLCLDDAKVTAYAKAMKAGAKVPGVEFYCEQVPVVRGRRS